MRITEYLKLSENRESGFIMVSIENDMMDKYRKSVLYILLVSAIFWISGCIPVVSERIGLIFTENSYAAESLGIRGVLEEEGFQFVDRAKNGLESYEYASDHGITLFIKPISSNEVEMTIREANFEKMEGLSEKGLEIKNNVINKIKIIYQNTILIKEE